MPLLSMLLKLDMAMVGGFSAGRSSNGVRVSPRLALS
jgi:hypothetical protein